MKKQIVNIAAGIVFSAAGAAQADIQIADQNPGASLKDASIAACVSAIQEYHTEDAKLFLSNKAMYREENGERILSVNGWVWKNGERVRVSHQCASGSKQLALNVQFDNQVQIADVK